MRLSTKLSIVSVVVLSATFASAQTTRPIGPLGPSSTMTSQTPGAGKAVITGTAVEAGEAPIPNAAVRLRNLATTQIDQTVVTSSTGQFAFAVQADVPYVVELVDGSGRILAVGDVVIPASGDAVSTIVAIPTKLPTFAGMFTDTAGSVLSAAMGLGLTTIQAGVLPFLSPER
jgi:hypothetical protein